MFLPIEPKCVFSHFLHVLFCTLSIIPTKVIAKGDSKLIELIRKGEFCTETLKELRAPYHTRKMLHQYISDNPIEFLKKEFMNIYNESPYNPVLYKPFLAYNGHRFRYLCFAMEEYYNTLEAKRNKFRKNHALYRFPDLRKPLDSKRFEKLKKELLKTHQRDISKDLKKSNKNFSRRKISLLSRLETLKTEEDRQKFVAGYKTLVDYVTQERMIEKIQYAIVQELSRNNLEIRRDKMAQIFANSTLIFELYTGNLGFLLEEIKYFLETENITSEVGKKIFEKVSEVSSKNTITYSYFGPVFPIFDQIYPVPKKTFVHFTPSLSYIIGVTDRMFGVYDEKLIDGFVWGPFQYQIHDHDHARSITVGNIDLYINSNLELRSINQVFKDLKSRRAFLCYLKENPGPFSKTQMIELLFEMHHELVITNIVEERNEKIATVKSSLREQAEYPNGWQSNIVKELFNSGRAVTLTPHSFNPKIRDKLLDWAGKSPHFSHFSKTEFKDQFDLLSQQIKNSKFAK